MTTQSKTCETCRHSIDAGIQYDVWCEKAEQFTLKNSKPACFEPKYTCVSPVINKESCESKTSESETQSEPRKTLAVLDVLPEYKGDE